MAPPLRGSCRARRPDPASASRRSRSRGGTERPSGQDFRAVVRFAGAFLAVPVLFLAVDRVEVVAFLAVDLVVPVAFLAVDLVVPVALLAAVLAVPVAFLAV